MYHTLMFVSDYDSDDLLVVTWFDVPECIDPQVMAESFMNVNYKGNWKQNGSQFIVPGSVQDQHSGVTLVIISRDTLEQLNRERAEYAELNEEIRTARRALAMGKHVHFDGSITD